MLQGRDRPYIIITQRRIGLDHITADHHKQSWRVAIAIAIDGREQLGTFTHTSRTAVTTYILEAKPQVAMRTREAGVHITLCSVQGAQRNIFSWTCR
jgi:hypothetical protein